VFLFKKLTQLVFISIFLFFLSVFIYYLNIRDELPDIQSLRDIKWQTPMQVYSNDGLLISQFGEKKRIPLKYEEIPQTLISALLATEDDRFYLHFGVDPIGMARAIWGQISGKDKGGASTITMQVARNFFLTREQTYIRKIREIFLSLQIESLLTKNEILTLYINKIPLGHRTFGFGSAAQVYYGKDINQLNLAQIAVLAGLPKAPSTYNPISRPDRAITRRTTVLKRMLVSGYISEYAYQQAKAAPITGKRHGASIELDAGYIAEMVNKEMIKRYGKKQAYTSGYKVFTTVTSKLQQAANIALTNNLLRYDQRHGYRGAISSLRPKELKSNQKITNEEIELALSKVATYQRLIPAVITEISDRSVNITLKDGVKSIILWTGMAWARPYVNDQKQGIPPKRARDIFSYGDIVLVSEISPGKYHLSQLPTASAAIVSISPDNGAIKAAVGGFSFKQSQFNRVTQAKRQVGSNIKPFLYSAALENGFTLASLINDAPINQWDKSSGIAWRPKNSPEVYAGPIRMRLALAQSKNVIAVRLLKSIGLPKAIEHLSSFGFAVDALPRSESLALGSASLTPLEVVTGFATFANGGFLVKPYLIDRIEDAEGKIIFQANPSLACSPCDITTITHDQMNLSNTTLSTPNNAMASTSNLSIQGNEVADTSSTTVSALRVISEQNAFLITQALNSVIWGADWSGDYSWQGTGWRARTLKRRDIAGKTGTTNEVKDAWFSGFSRHLVTTSWIGFDNPTRKLGKSYYNSNLDKNQITGTEHGAKSAQPAWIELMKVALTDLPVESFEPPSGIVSVRIDKVTGKLTTKTDKSSIFEYFNVGTEPTEYVIQNNSINIFQSEDDEENKNSDNNDENELF